MAPALLSSQSLKAALRARWRRPCCPTRGRNSWPCNDMKRRFDPNEPELMDRPQPVSVELESDLRNLRALNRYFGSYRLVRHFLRGWIRPNDRLRVLDLATGSGDVPRMIVG